MFQKRAQKTALPPDKQPDVETQNLADLHKKLTGYQSEQKKSAPAAKKASRFFFGRSFRNTFLITFLLVILGGYAVFFTSSFWLPYSGNYSFTPLGSAVEFANHRTLTLSRWDYSPQQNLMEVELEIDNPNFDGLDQYLCDVVIRTGSGEQKGRVKTMVAQDDFFVLHLTNIPKNFTELSLRVQVNSETVTGTAKIFSNKDEIRQVSSLTAKTKSEYLKDRVLALTEEYQQQIQILQKTNEELSAKIENIQKKNAQLEADKKYLTDQDIEKTNQRIASNESQIESAREQILGNESAISEYQLKIQKAKEKAQDISSQIQKENQMQQQSLTEEFGSAVSSAP